MQAYVDPELSATLDDWSFSLAFAQDQARYAFPVEPLRPCGNTACTNQSYACFCCESCRLIVEGPDEPADDDVYYSDGEGCLLGHRQLSDTQAALDGDLVRRACGLPQEPAAAVAQPLLPEAAASATVRLTIAGHSDVLFTVRDMDETRLLQRLETLLSRFPVQAPVVQAPVAQEPPHVCPVHQVPMERQTNERGSWWSHRSNSGWCRGKGVKHG